MTPARDARPVPRRLLILTLALAIGGAGCGSATGSVAPATGAGPGSIAPVVGSAGATGQAPPTFLATLLPALTLPPAPSVTATAIPASAAATPVPSVTFAGDVIEAGRLLSCIDFPTPVMAEYDADGKAIGVNVEIAGEVATRLGLEVVVRDTVFETLIDEIAGGRCDISISSQIITRSRLKQIAMVPYLQGVQHVVVREGNPTGITMLIDLCGQVLAVQSGTTHVDLVLGEGDQAGTGLNQQCAAAGRSDVDLRQFADAEGAVDALASGDADAYIGNDFVIIERPGLFELAADLPPIRLGIGVNLAKVALHAAIRTAVADMIADGTYDRILETYDVSHLALAEAP